MTGGGVRVLSIHQQMLVFGAACCTAGSGSTSDAQHDGHLTVLLLVCCTDTEETFLGWGGADSSSLEPRRTMRKRGELFYPKQIFVFGGESLCCCRTPHPSSESTGAPFCPPPLLSPQSASSAWEECRGASH